MTTDCPAVRFFVSESRAYWSGPNSFDRHRQWARRCARRAERRWSSALARRAREDYELLACSWLSRGDEEY